MGRAIARLSAVVAVAGLALGSGCCGLGLAANSVELSAKAKREIRSEPNSDLAASVEIQSMDVAYKDQTLEASVVIQNNHGRRFWCSDQELPLEYRFEWFDGDGRQVGDTSPNWMPFRLEAAAKKNIVVSAPAPGCDKAKFHVRPSTGR